VCATLSYGLTETNSSHWVSFKFRLLIFSHKNKFGTSIFNVTVCCVFRIDIPCAEQRSGKFSVNIYSAQRHMHQNRMFAHVPCFVLVVEADVICWVVSMRRKMTPWIFPDNLFLETSLFSSVSLPVICFWSSCEILWQLALAFHALRH